jgi:WD40-like Beta Propeller Repeat
LDIYVSQRASVDDPWGPPANLGPTINSASNDHCAFIPPDDESLVFVSDRPGGAGAGDFYIAYRDDKGDDLGWGAPANLGAINSSFDEFGPWGFEAEGTGNLNFFFTSNRPGGPGGYDIYTSVRGPDGIFGAPVLVPELSSTAADTFPVVRKDGLELFLSSDRTGTLGGFDLWVATRESTADPWSTPVNLGSIVNGTANEQRAAISFDGSTIIFFSDRLGGSGGFDLYQTTRTKLKGEPDP